MARRSYIAWRSKQKQKPLRELKDTKNTPKITFIVSWDGRSNEDIVNTLQSLNTIEGENWEAFLYSEHEDIQKQLPDGVDQDTHFRIINSVKDFFSKDLTGKFVVLCQAGDQFDRDILHHFFACHSEKDEVDWYYFDCEYRDDQKGTVTPLFKPPILSPTLLISHNYLSRGFIRALFLKDYLESEGGNKTPLGLEYSLALKLYEKNAVVEHIPKVLVRQQSLVKPITDHLQKIITKHLSTSGLKDISTQSRPNGIWFRWKTTDPDIAVVIPTKNNIRLLSICLSSLIKRTNYQNFTIHIVDNNSDDPETLNYYQQLKSSESRIKIHPYRAEFNYSQANNLGAAQSESKLLLFLNDDIEVYDPNWLDELVQWAERPEIGVIGAKLIRSNHIIQHAGIIMGLNGFTGHIYLNAPEHYQGLFGSVDWYRDYMAVTGACQMIRRKVFDEVDGFDEGYQLAFGDVDLCLRVRQKGYRVVYSPHASLFHYEGQSRGYSTPREDIIRSYDKMESILSSDDPYFSPNLSYTGIPKCIVDDRREDELESQFRERKNLFQNK